MGTTIHHFARPTSVFIDRSLHLLNLSFEHRYTQNQATQHFRLKLNALCNPMQCDFLGHSLSPCSGLISAEQCL
ncbi:MAG: hypothetical protein ACAF41_01460 [Leptolyngbya sp. BL-A-14]